MLTVIPHMGACQSINSIKQWKTQAMYAISRKLVMKFKAVYGCLHNTTVHYHQQQSLLQRIYDTESSVIYSIVLMSARVCLGQY